MEYKPIPYKPKCRIVKDYWNVFTDRSGNRANLHKVDYIDKKGKLQEGFVLQVKWFNPASKQSGGNE